MALSFIQWEKYIQGFPDDRLAEEFKDPGSTVPGLEKPPQNLVVSEMGNRNSARRADKAMQESQNQPNGTIAEQTYDEFAGEDRPVGGPGGGPPPGGGGGPPPGGGGPPGGPRGPGGPGGPRGPGGPGGPPPGGPPMGPGGPPMGPGGPGGPPPGGPPMMAYGGLVPGYQEGGDTENRGFMSGLGSFLTGAGSLEEARDKPLRTLGRSALSAASFIPGIGLLGWGGRAALGLSKGRRLQKLLEGAGRGTLKLRESGRSGKFLARLLDPKQARSKTPGWMGGAPGSWIKNPKTGKKVWNAGAGTKSGMSGIGRRSIARGGGALGIAGLLALDPFDAGEEEVTGPEGPPPNKDLADTPAIRADRAKGFGGGGYDWVNEEGKARRDLRQLIEHREAGIAKGDFPEDFQDRMNQEWMSRVSPRQGYATLSGMASGGIIGLYNGGEHSGAQGYASLGDPDELPEGTDFETYQRYYTPDADMGQSMITKGGGARGIPIQRVRGEIEQAETGGDFARLGGWLSERGVGPFAMEQRERAQYMKMKGASSEEIEAALAEARADRNRSDREDRLSRISGRTDPELFQLALEGTTSEGWSPTRAESDSGEDVPKDEGIPEEMSEEVSDIGMGISSRDGSPEGMAADVAARMTTEAEDREDWLRTQTSAESAQDEYWATRAQGARDDARSRLYADVAGAIAGSGGVRGNIGKGLKEAIYGQIEQGDLARDYEGLPITAAAARSRGSTFVAQQGVLKDVYAALMSRGEMDAQVEGRIKEMAMQLERTGRLTSRSLIEFQEILREAVYNGMPSEEAAEHMANLTSKSLAQELSIPAG